MKVFEGLSEGEQDILLDDIAIGLDKYSLSIFEKARKNNDSPHKKPMITIHLKAALRKHGLLK